MILLIIPIVFLYFWIRRNRVRPSEPYVSEEDEVGRLPPTNDELYRFQLLKSKTIEKKVKLVFRRECNESLKPLLRYIEQVQPDNVRKLVVKLNDLEFLNDSLVDVLNDKIGICDISPSILQTIESRLTAMELQTTIATQSSVFEKINRIHAKTYNTLSKRIGSKP
jgi:hypothetical protein